MQDEKGANHEIMSLEGTAREKFSDQAKLIVIR